MTNGSVRRQLRGGAGPARSRALFFCTSAPKAAATSGAWRCPPISLCPSSRLRSRGCSSSSAASDAARLFPRRLWLRSRDSRCDSAPPAWSRAPMARSPARFLARSRRRSVWTGSREPARQHASRHGDVKTCQWRVSGVDGEQRACAGGPHNKRARLCFILPRRYLSRSGAASGVGWCANCARSRQASSAPRRTRGRACCCRAGPGSRAAPRAP